MYQHSILVVCDATTYSMVFSFLDNLIKSHLLSAVTEEHHLSLALFVATPQAALRTKVRKVIKHGTAGENVREALVELRQLAKLADEEFFAAEVGGVDRVCALGGLLRGLAAEPWNDNPSVKKRASIFFSDPPRTDIHGPLQSLIIKDIGCEFVYLSQLESTDEARDRLAELAMLVAGYENCTLRRVSVSTPTEDISRVRTTWHEWLHPPSLAAFKLAKDQLLSVKLVPLVQSGKGLSSCSVPNGISLCSCHNTPVSRPARCAISGRKPKCISVPGYALGEGALLAPELGSSFPTIIPLATIPDSALDCCLVMGSPVALAGKTEAVSHSLVSLASEMQRRRSFLVVRCTSPHMVTLHVVAAAADGALTMIRVAGKEDVLMSSHISQTPSSPTPTGMQAAADLLDSLPAPRTFNPLSFSTGWTDAMASRIVEEK